MVNLFLLINNATLVDVTNVNERQIFQLGNTFGFNYLVKFDGLSYVFLGNFGALPGHAVIWRVVKLLDLLDARAKALPIRILAGLATQEATALGEFFMKRLEIWLIVNGEKEKAEATTWLGTQTVPFRIEIFTLGNVTERVSQLPSS
jgi:hypothetical protein